MWIVIYLRLDHAGAEVQDGGDPARKAPELLLSVPVAARCLDDGVQSLLVGLRLDEEHFGCSSADGLAADEQLYSGVPHLSLGICPVSNTDQSVTVATGKFDRASICWSQGLDDAVSAAF
jgi:hypothetical protein